MILASMVDPAMPAWNAVYDRLQPSLDAAGKVIPDEHGVLFTRNGTTSRVNITDQIAQIQDVATASAGYWMAVMEKAYAFFRTGADTFNSLNFGALGDVLSDLNIPFVYGVNGIVTVANITAQLKAGKYVGMATPAVTLPVGWVSNHEYQLALVNGVLTGMNPWGIFGSSVVVTDDFLSKYIDTNALCTASLPARRIPGDANGDGKVDFADQLIVAQGFGAKVVYPGMFGDANYDGEVDFGDLLLVAQNFGKGN